MNARNLSAPALVVLLVGTIAGGAASSPAADLLPRCRPNPDGAMRLPEMLHFVGTAVPDTIPAGPGTGVPDSLRTAARDRPVYGQLVRVHVVSAGANAELQEAFARSGTGEIVMVPWDFHATCETAYWSESARWIQPGPEGLYKVRLRPRDEWVGGRPTADAFRAATQPYPHGTAYREGFYGTQGLHRGEALTPREYFSLHSILPTPAELRQRDPAARERVREWETSHPQLVGRYPAGRIIAELDRHFGAAR